MRRLRLLLTCCLLVAILPAMSLRAADQPIPQPPPTKTPVPTYGRTYKIKGLPQSDYNFNVTYEHGTVKELSCAGTVALIITPKGKIDPERRWVWVTNIFLALNDTICGPTMQRWYIEHLLERGFHIVGIDVGGSCGSPKGAEVYEEFYQYLMKEYHLNSKARMIGQSNGGLITYGFAFRHPEQVDRIMGICPATDFTSWPGWDRLCGPGQIVPAGLSYGMTRAELEPRIKEFNPIDNIAPLVKAGIKAYHIHGTNDPLVPLEPNSGEFSRRYQQLGGDIEVEIIQDGTHGAPNAAFFESQKALEFLLQ